MPYGSPKASPRPAPWPSLPREQWKRLSVGTGAKGPRMYAWARLRVIESRDGFPGPEGWLLARQSVSDPTKLTCYFALATKRVSLQQLATVSGTRYTVEQGIEEGKGETGLDQYAVRHWPSWYRHITLSMVAHAWLADQRASAGKKAGLEDLTVPEVRRLLEGALPWPERNVCERLAWSTWRRRTCYRARLCHCRHRFWPKYAGGNPLDSS